MPISTSPFATSSATGRPLMNFVRSLSSPAMPSFSITLAAILPEPPVRIADRLGIEHGGLERLDGRDIGLGHTHLHGDADAGLDEVDAGAGHDLALRKEARQRLRSGRDH